MSEKNIPGICTVHHTQPLSSRTAKVGDSLSTDLYSLTNGAVRFGSQSTQWRLFLFVVTEGCFMDKHRNTIGYSWEIRRRPRVSRKSINLGSTLHQKFTRKSDPRYTPAILTFEVHSIRNRLMIYIECLERLENQTTAHVECVLSTSDQTNQNCSQSSTDQNLQLPICLVLGSLHSFCISPIV